MWVVVPTTINLRNQTNTFFHHPRENGDPVAYYNHATDTRDSRFRGNDRGLSLWQWVVVPGEPGITKFVECAVLYARTHMVYEPDYKCFIMD